MPPARGMEVIADGVLAEALGRAPDNHFVIWTGHTYGNWGHSLRSAALATVTEVGEPIAVREVMRRAARIDGNTGYDPDTVRSGIRQHQSSKPAVYLLVERTPAGDYVAVTTIGSAGPERRRIEKGAAVLDRYGRMHVKCLAAPGLRPSAIRPEGTAHRPAPPPGHGRPPYRLLGATATAPAGPDVRVAPPAPPPTGAPGKADGPSAPAQRRGEPSIRSFPARTRARVEAVAAYLHRHVLRDGAFICPHHAACRASAEAAGQSFFEGQLHHIGRHYDLEVDGRPTRIVAIGQEYGTAQRNVGLPERSRMVAESAAAGFRGRNPHMRGTTTTLRLLLGREPGEDREGEWLGGAVGAHLFDAFALVDFLLCSAVRREVRYDQRYRGSPNGRSTPAMQRNCGPHLRRVLELLEPTIIVVQGVNVRRWLAAPLGLPPEGPLVETVALRGAPVLMLNLVHPSAPSGHWWGQSPHSRYVREVVRPTIRRLIGLPAG